MSAAALAGAQSRRGEPEKSRPGLFHILLKHDVAKRRDIGASVGETQAR